jgi:hypothetical protein
LSILLLHLVYLLIDLLSTLAVVPVVEEHSASILNHLEFRAHNSQTQLDSAVLVRCALVLLLPGSGYIVVWREGVLLELLRVLLDDGHVPFELGQTVVAELISLGEVRVCDAVGALEVRVEGRDEAAVCVGCEVQGAGANVGVLEGLDGVVHDGVGLKMLIGALVVYKSGVLGRGVIGRTETPGVHAS